MTTRPKQATRTTKTQHTQDLSPADEFLMRDFDAMMVRIDTEIARQKLAMDELLARMRRRAA